MLNSIFLLPYILQPTRITERSATLIDNIFANTYAMNAISGNLVPKISDHLPTPFLLMVFKFGLSLTYPTYLPLSTHVVRRLSGYGAHFSFVNKIY